MDTAVERTRLELARGDRDAACECLDRAKRLTKSTERPYVPHVPDWADWEPPEGVGVFKEGESVGYHRRDPAVEALERELDGEGGAGNTPKAARQNLHWATPAKIVKTCRPRLAALVRVEV